MKQLKELAQDLDHNLLDVMAPENLANPYPMFQYMLEHAPVYHDDKNGYWVVSRYDDIQFVLRDPRISADRYRFIVKDLNNEEREKDDYIVRSLSMFLLNIENPAHKRLRTLTNKSFHPQLVESMRPYAARIVNELLEPFFDKGELDIVDDIAFPMPIIFICRILGLPTTDIMRLRKLSDAISVYIGSAGKAIGCISPAYDAIVELSEMFRPLVEQRRQDPRDDLISSMASTRIDGDQMTDDEVIANCILFLVAGFETVTTLIATGVLALLEHPEQLKVFRDNPHRSEATIDEILRYYPPVNRTARIALESISLRGQIIGKGELIIVMLGAGNRDPSVYKNPDIFDVMREERAKILSFGSGHHFCIGSFLGRMEGEVALTTLFECLPNMALVLSEQKWRGGSRFRGLEKLPVHF